MKKLLILSLLLISDGRASAGELDKLLLSPKELPAGVRLMEPTPKMPRFCNGKNPAVIIAPAAIKEFCLSFFKDDSLAPHLSAVSFTALKLLNEIGIFGHQLRDPGKADEIKRAYEPLTTRFKSHRFIQSGDVLILVWSKDPIEEQLDAIETTLRGKLQTVK